MEKNKIQYAFAQSQLSRLIDKYTFKNHHQ
jgi:hypothetical protein